MLFTCEKHNNAIVVHNVYHCPVCEEIEELKNDIEKNEEEVGSLNQDLCDLEQEFFYNSIINDVDLTDHQEDAVNSLRIVLAADESFRTGKVVGLE